MELKSPDDILSQFRERLKDIIKQEHTDQNLSRWLRARNYDLDKAEDMFRKNQEWRTKWEMDTVLEDYQPPEVLLKYFPGGHCGFDKEGAPVWITPSGNLDIKGLTMSCKKQEIIRYNMYLVEKVHRIFQEQSQKLGHTVDKVVLVDDLDGFSLTLLFSQGMDVVLRMLSIVEANYPEALKRCYIVNAPSYWNLIYNMCKPFMSEDTKRKIVILGDDWKDRLLEIIDADQLPEHWGGMMTDPDGNPKCPSKVSPGGEVPKKYYRCIDQYVDRSRLTNVAISAGGKLDLDVTVEEPNSVLRWVFQTVNCDIGFSISMRKDPNGDKEEIVPYKRLSSHIVFEDGTHECPVVGTYTVHFDNSYSWMTTKQVTYMIEIIQPSDQIKRSEDAKQNHLDDVYGGD